MRQELVDVLFRQVARVVAKSGGPFHEEFCKKNAETVVEVVVANFEVVVGSVVIVAAAAEVVIASIGASMVVAAVVVIAVIKVEGDSLLGRVETVSTVAIVVGSRVVGETRVSACSLLFGE